MLDAINTLTNCLVAMKKFKDFVENMVLLEGKKNTWWQDRNIPRFMVWLSPTRMLSDLLVTLWVRENSFPHSHFRGANYFLDITKIFDIYDYGALTVVTIWTWSYCESQPFGLQCNSVSAAYVFHSRKFF